MEKQIKILMVDDEEDFIKPMAFWFETKGYKVISAGDGKTGLELIKKEKPDIIFLDLNMPVMDGSKTLQEIRKHDKNIPIVIISAYSDPQKIKEMQPYGVSGIFYKGEDFEKGLSLLESILRTHKRLQK